MQRIERPTDDAPNNSLQSLDSPEKVPDNAESKVPDSLICSLSQQIFREPVTVFPSGHTFEDEMLDQHINYCVRNSLKPFCPTTREPIDQIVVAWAMKNVVEEFMKRYPDADQYQPINLGSYPSRFKSSVVKSAAFAHAAQSAPVSEIARQVREDEIFAQELQRTLQMEAGEEAKKVPAAAKVEESTLLRINEALERTNREHRLAMEALLARAKKAEIEAEAFKRERRSHEPLRAMHERNRLVAAEDRAPAVEKNQEVSVDLADDIHREMLLKDLQNLIYALGFEKDPLNTSKAESKLFSPAPIPWQKIEVAQGPKNLAMHEVLKAATDALKKLNPSILSKSKEVHAHQYDLVQTKLCGIKSLGNSSYAGYASKIGTVTNQPGQLVNQILRRVENMLRDLCNKYAIEARPITVHRPW